MRAETRRRIEDGSAAISGSEYFNGALGGLESFKVPSIVHDSFLCH